MGDLTFAGEEEALEAEEEEVKTKATSSVFVARSMVI